MSSGWRAPTSRTTRRTSACSCRGPDGRARPQGRPGGDRAAGGRARGHLGLPPLVHRRPARRDRHHRSAPGRHLAADRRPHRGAPGARGRSRASRPAARAAGRGRAGGRRPARGGCRARSGGAAARSARGGTVPGARRGAREPPQRDGHARVDRTRLQARAGALREGPRGHGRGGPRAAGLRGGRRAADGRHRAAGAAARRAARRCRGRRRGRRRAGARLAGDDDEAPGRDAARLAGGRRRAAQAHGGRRDRQSGRGDPHARRPERHVAARLRARDRRRAREDRPGGRHQRRRVPGQDVRRHRDRDRLAGGVHAQERADEEGAREPRLPRQDRRPERRRYPQARTARRRRAAPVVESGGDRGPEDLAVVTRGLTKRFGKVVAVDHLELRVRRGELYGFLGPNGAGKSTTLRMLCGILEPSDGEGHVLGIDLRKNPERVKSAIGYMSQRFSLYDDLTVDENLTFYARVYMVPRGERTARIGRMVRLADLVGRERQLAGQLSGGYRQRLALACALVHTPALIFLDEPTAGVDPVSRRTFWALIRRLADEGTTILVTTHYMDEAELCDSLGFIYQGRLIATGSPAEIKTRAFGRLVVEIAAADPRAAAEVLSDWAPVEEVVRVGGRLRLIVAPGGPGAAGVREHLVARGIGVSLAAEVEPSVEDLFVSFVDRERKGRVREQL